MLRRCMLTGIAVSSTMAAAGPFDGKGSLAHQMNGSSLKSGVDLDLMRVDPFDHSSFQLKAFSGTKDPLRTLLEDKGLHPYLGMKLMKRIDTGAFGLTQTSGSRIQSISDYEFQVGAHAVCGVTLRVVEHGDGSTVVVGSIPTVDQVMPFQDEDWPSASASARRAIAGVAQQQGLNEHDGKVAAMSRCVLNEQGNLEPVWNFVITFADLQYTAWSTESRIAYAAPRHFDANATVRAYDSNRVSGALKDYTIEVTGDGTLSNELFQAGSALGGPRASDDSNNFVYGITDPRFEEASTFAYANQQYDFVKSMGYTWSGPKPVKIAVHANIGGTTSNAFYSPSVTGEPPVIFVGDGDGKTLQNLAFDADVVGHEFGHHVVFQSITRRDGESLVLHEGLADFLANARSGNACLGESVCPEQSAVCYVRSKCLRTADNTLNYTSDEYRYMSDPHRKGQLVSGFLWDLRKNGVMAGDTLTRYVLEAIPYLPANAGFKSLVAAMLFVAQKHDGTYAGAITDAATARGLSPESLDIYMTDLTGSLKNPPVAASDDDDSGKKKGFLGCGAIGSDQGGHQGSAAYLVVLLFGLPLFFQIVAKVRKARSL